MQELDRRAHRGAGAAIGRGVKRQPSGARATTTTRGRDKGDFRIGGRDGAQLPACLVAMPGPGRFRILLPHSTAANAKNRVAGTAPKTYRKPDWGTPAASEGDLATPGNFVR